MTRLHHFLFATAVATSLFSLSASAQLTRTQASPVSAPSSQPGASSQSGTASSTPSGATAAPASADDIIKDACKEAAASHRKVFIIFHASWCGWCHRMDNQMESKECKALFDDHYVIRHLVILESKDKKDLENPGAQELYTKYAGPQGQGIPFWLIMDEKGQVIADSRVKPDSIAPNTGGNNSGCPSEPDEVAYFLRVLHATSPLTDDQLQIISKTFTIHK